MACSIEPEVWSPLDSVTGKLVDEDGSYRLLVEDGTGIPDHLPTLVVSSDAPLAIRFTPDNGCEYSPGAAWSDACPDVTTIGPIALPAGGFAFDDKGKALGYFTENAELKFFYVNLMDFPVLFELNDGAISLQISGGDPSMFFLVDL